MGGRCCYSLRGARGWGGWGLVSGDERRMPKSLFNYSGAVLVSCSGPWDPVWLINKLCICTMCLQHLWASHRMMKDYHFFYIIHAIFAWMNEGSLSCNKEGLISTSRTIIPNKNIFVQCHFCYLQSHRPTCEPSMVLTKGLLHNTIMFVFIEVHTYAHSRQNTA